jgi:hypothetical protein
MALGKASPGFISHQITVVKLRHREAQGSVQEQLPCRGLQQICSAHDLADLHGTIISNDRKLVGRNIVATPDHKVAKVAACDEPLPSQMLIEKGDFLPIRNPDAASLGAVADRANSFREQVQG